MAVERNVGESTAGNSARPLPTPFLSKTYQLVDDAAIDDVISWNEDGSTFIVWNNTEFARDLLPKHFKHNNFSSFVRQLNTYGFRKVVPDRWEFSNDCFRKGQKCLLCDIQRRKITTPVAGASAVVTTATAPAPLLRTVSTSDSGEEQVISSNSSPVAAPFRQSAYGGSTFTTELIGENERLRKDNMQLNKELSQMKNLCNSIYGLMSNFANNQAESSAQVAFKPLDLMPEKRLSDNSDAADRDTNRSDTDAIPIPIPTPTPTPTPSPRLFGFPIGVKRVREGEGEGGEKHQDLQLQQPGTEVKSEPFDHENSGDNQDNRWLRRCHLSHRMVCNE